MGIERARVEQRINNIVIERDHATLIQRHSQWVDLELADRSVLHATLGGKLKGVRLVCGDRVRYSAVPLEPDDPRLPTPLVPRGEGGSPEAQVVALDEVQFMDEGLIAIVEELANRGVRVIAGNNPETARVGRAHQKRSMPA